MSKTHLLVLLTVLLALVVVLVLAGALIVVRQRLTASRRGSRPPGALAGVEAEHLRPLEGSVQKINAQFEIILGALPGIARKAATVAERRPR